MVEKGRVRRALGTAPDADLPSPDNSCDEAVHLAELNQVMIDAAIYR